MSFIRNGKMFLTMRSINKDNEMLEAQELIKRCESGLYGIVLNETQALLLLKKRADALTQSKRIELNGSVVAALIEAFSTSGYISITEPETSLADLIELFYDFKNETKDRVSDQKILQFMREAYDGRCGGSVQLLQDEAVMLGQYMNEGGEFDEYESNRKEYGSP